uniref:Uncharacterized protein n=1 Tax=Rhizophora mucronata TaxID=61149 RepID=A0A2P2Q7J5_RHIMU
MKLASMFNFFEIIINSKKQTKKMERLIMPQTQNSCVTIELSTVPYQSHEKDFPTENMTNCHSVYRDNILFEKQSTSILLSQ